MRNANFEGDEKEFQREIEPVLTKLRSNVGTCPHPDRVQAVLAGVQFEGFESVRKHLEACPICEVLGRDLSAYEYPELTPEEDRRIRARLPQTSRVSTRSVSRWAWMWRPVPLAAAAAIVAIIVVIGLTNLRTPPAAVQQSAKSQDVAPLSTVQRTAFILQKAAIKVPAAAVLTYRSGADSQKIYLDDLAAALAPYRSEDYAEAARQLETLARKYPKSIEPQFYLGVSLLFLNENDKALESLGGARSISSDALHDDVSWYLALALDRAGRMDDARHEVENLCSRSGEYQQMACAAAQELRR
jgi:tetratricopeptide (TPR) repeat protein